MADKQPTTPRDLLNAEELERIGRAVAAAELGTSGEIRIRLEKSCAGDPLDRARELLGELDMNQTRGRTGVLLYVAVADRRFAIYGDEAIHAVIGQAGWTAICAQLGQRFAAGAFCDGLCEAVAAVGRALAGHFPRAADDLNELPDAPSMEE